MIIVKPSVSAVQFKWAHDNVTLKNQYFHVKGTSSKRKKAKGIAAFLQALLLEQFLTYPQLKTFDYIWPVILGFCI